MIENVLRHMGGIEGFGVVSVCLFFAFFIGMLVWAFRLRKPYLEEMAARPLDVEAGEPVAGSHDYE
ncbi:MAG: hypothetical protein H7A45_01920 [Verrucomicrobiales bacterium]|nr:hypothetical protein [Verrucomicrobiales bacterium]MCP5526582.1 hypothetical protein [Verrucomicrobiales bacterium]